MGPYDGLGSSYKVTKGYADALYAGSTTVDVDRLTQDFAESCR